jgi:hypothetical protein
MEFGCAASFYDDAALHLALTCIPTLASWRQLLPFQLLLWYSCMTHGRGISPLRGREGSPRHSPAPRSARPIGLLHRTILWFNRSLTIWDEGTIEGTIGNGEGLGTPQHGIPPASGLGLRNEGIGLGQIWPVKEDLVPTWRSQVGVGRAHERCEWTKALSRILNLWTNCFASLPSIVRMDWEGRVWWLFEAPWFTVRENLYLIETQVQQTFKFRFAGWAIDPWEFVWKLHAHK